jgi:hypothetical protein
MEGIIDVDMERNVQVYLIGLHKFLSYYEVYNLRNVIDFLSFYTVFIFKTTFQHLTPRKLCKQYSLFHVMVLPCNKLTWKLGRHPRGLFLFLPGKQSTSLEDLL